MGVMREAIQGDDAGQVANLSHLAQLVLALAQLAGLPPPPALAGILEKLIEALGG